MEGEKGTSKISNIKKKSNMKYFTTPHTALSLRMI